MIDKYPEPSSPSTGSNPNGKARYAIRSLHHGEISLPNAYGILNGGTTPREMLYLGHVARGLAYSGRMASLDKAEEYYSQADKLGLAEDQPEVHFTASFHLQQLPIDDIILGTQQLPSRKQIHETVNNTVVVGARAAMKLDSLKKTEGEDDRNTRASLVRVLARITALALAQDNSTRSRDVTQFPQLTLAVNYSAMKDSDITFLQETVCGMETRRRLKVYPGDRLSRFPNNPSGIATLNLKRDLRLPNEQFAAAPSIIKELYERNHDRSPEEYSELDIKLEERQRLLFKVVQGRPGRRR